MPELISITQAADLLGVTRNTVWTLIHRGRLKRAPRELWPAKYPTMLYLDDVKEYRDTRRLPMYTPPRKGE